MADPRLCPALPNFYFYFPAYGVEECIRNGPRKASASSLLFPGGTLTAGNRPGLSWSPQSLGVIWICCLRLLQTKVACRKGAVNEVRCESSQPDLLS